MGPARAPSISFPILIKVRTHDAVLLPAMPVAPAIRHAFGLEPRLSVGAFGCTKDAFSDSQTCSHVCHDRAG